jgi:DNA-binding transcriptional ArsR family regulator
MAVAPRIVQDVETLKALADPVRLAILDLVMADYQRTWTAKDLATAIRMPPKKIYYHLGLLEQRGLLEVRDTAVVNGIIEKHYGAAQESITFQHGSPLAEPKNVSPDTTEEMGQLVTTLFDEARTNIIDGLRSGQAVLHRDAPATKRLLVSYSTVAMAPERAGEFRDTLRALIDEFQDANTPGAPRYDMLITIGPHGNPASDEGTQSADSPD